MNKIIWYYKLFVGGLLVFCCIFGISLAIYPGWFKRFFKKEKHFLKTQKKGRKLHGHHPDCGQFENHIVNFKNRTFCSGCIGLSIGCFISIFFVLIYIFFNIGLDSNIWYLVFIFGLIMIFFVFIEIVFKGKYRFFHIFSNVILVFGFVIVSISIFELTGDKIYGLLGIIFSFLWLDTRIQLSNYLHSSICSDCVKKCKMY
jgi:hypothetical protein